MIGFGFGGNFGGNSGSRGESKPVESKPMEPKKITGLLIPEDAPIFADTVTQVYGKKIHGSLIPLSQINPEDDESLVWV